MRKSIALLMVILTVFCLVACSKTNVDIPDDPPAKSTISTNQKNEKILIDPPKDDGADNSANEATESEVRLSQTIASGTCGTKLTWILNDNGVVTISGSGEMYDWDTPFSSAIRAVRSPFFDYRGEIHRIVLEEGIVNIGNYAFAECQELSHIEIPKTVTCIGNGAFKNCKQISSIFIPDTVTQIGYEAFYYCQNMSELDIPSSITSIGSEAFRGCSQLTGITIPSGVQNIGRYTFNNCTNLATLTINNGVVSLGQGAFYGCCGLTSVDLPDSLTEIDYEAFRGCRELSNISIPASVTDIDSSAFRECSNRLVFHVESNSVAENYAKKYGFIFITDDAPTATDKKTKVLSSVCDIGDYVTFGKYPQTASGDDSTPIEWLVLAREGQNVLLLSRYGLDTQRYDKKNKEVTWEECTLRKWLNDTFFKRAFSLEEQKSVLITNIDNSHSQCSNDFKTNGGKDTQDKVFLLSCSEANTYLGVTYLDNQVSSRVSPTEYAVKQGASTHKGHITIEGKDACTYWLRSPGIALRNADSVSDSGSFSMISYAVNYDGICVRPACWVDLDSLDR